MSARMLKRCAWHSSFHKRLLHHLCYFDTPWTHSLTMELTRRSVQHMPNFLTCHKVCMSVTRLIVQKIKIYIAQNFCFERIVVPCVATSPNAILQRAVWVEPSDWRECESVITWRHSIAEEKSLLSFYGGGKGQLDEAMTRRRTHSPHF